MILLTDVKKVYNLGKPNEVHALRGVSLAVPAGTMVAIMGPSGSGKSTLLNILGCMDNLTSGSYRLDGEDVTCMKQDQLALIRNKRIGFVLQDFGLLLDRTVEENVLVPLLFSAEPLRSSRKRINPVLESLQIAELAKRKASQLSGGQAQRVAIARAIVNQPDILLADEPTGALDSDTAGEVVGICRDLNRMGKTVIIVTHNKMVGDACDITYTIRDGYIAETKATAGV